MPLKLTCAPKLLPETSWFAAAQTAIDVNPVNRPRIEHLAMAAGLAPEPALISVLTTKFWGAKGVKLSVSFMDNPPSDLRRRIVQHMNAWAKTANVTFTETARDGQVRIARVADGYWSYVGTDVLHIPRNQQTMNLEGFTMRTPESEYCRVVRHETGHTLGMPHEHMRRELVDRIDVAKAIRYFGQTQGWSEQMVRQQVLTPIEEALLRGTAHSDERSIMCYQIPGEITKNGKPILGGVDIDTSDATFAALIYPKPRGLRRLFRSTKPAASAKSAKAASKSAKPAKPATRASKSSKSSNSANGSKRSKPAATARRRVQL